METQELNIRGISKLVEAVIRNVVDCIESPAKLFAPKHRKENHYYWLKKIVEWTRDERDVWLSSFETLFEYDRNQIATKIREQAEAQIGKYETEDILDKIVECRKGRKGYKLSEESKQRIREGVHKEGVQEKRVATRFGTKTNE